jgi:hypothetical protein
MQVISVQVVARLAFLHTHISSRPEEEFIILHRFLLNPNVKLMCSLAIQTTNLDLGWKNYQTCNLQVFWTKCRPSKQALMIVALVVG